MSPFDYLSDASNYQFPCWSTSSSSSRSYSNLRTNKDFINDIKKLTIDNRNQLPRSDSSSSLLSLSTKRIIQHHIRIPTASGFASPPPLHQPSTSPDLINQYDNFIPKPRIPRRYRSIPVRIKSTSLSIPITKSKEKLSVQNFPRQIHEQRKITHERKRRLQQAQFLADKYAESDTWFQLKRSLSELKRLATTPSTTPSTTQDIFIDQSTTSSLYSDGQTLKQVINDENKKETRFKAESNDITVTFSTNENSRTNLSTSQSSCSRIQTTKTYPRTNFEPLIVISKPIYPLVLSNNHNTLSKLRIKQPPPPPSPLYRSRPITTPLSEEKRARLLLSDLSNDDNIQNSITPSPSQMIKIEREIPSQKSSTRVRAPSTIQLTSTIKIKRQTPRCHSATDINSSSLINKPSLRFILICDQEHRIESWYHQYPFVHSDDLLTSFQSAKTSTQKSIISAFFIDDLQSLSSSKTNITAKTFLQGKPFHINNDWKKYDLIFISNNIYEQIISYLQTIINLIKLSGKIIQIYQINHEEDLKKQVKNICKQLQQQNI